MSSKFLTLSDATAVVVSVLGGAACSPAVTSRAASPPPISSTSRCPIAAPGEGRPTLHVSIGEHWVDVLESDLAGDVMVDGKAILHRDLQGDAPPWADLVRYFGPIAPFEGVVLLSWRGPGNACNQNGWGFTFLGVRADGTWTKADVPYCGGPAPLITWAPSSVTMLIPPHPPNRGDGMIPAETWIYESGAVRRSP